jgi:hypothetical protein
MKNEHNEERKALHEKLETAKAELEALRTEINARRLETAHKALALSIRHELVSHIVGSPIKKGYSKEHLRIINDLPNHKIEFHVIRQDEDQRLTLSWPTAKYVTALCDRRLVGALETNLVHTELKIVSAATREMFVSRCIEALGLSELKEAA